ncbi:hypothetical protein K6H10_000414 [Candida tropicalis]
MFSSKFNPIHSHHEDINDQFIRNVDYNVIEEEFGVVKYYPNYVHNPGISTPELKSLIEDKPIYKQVKTKQFKKEIREERKELRDQIKEEKKELRDQRRRSNGNIVADPYKQETQFRQRNNSYQPLPLSVNNTMNSTNNSTINSNNNNCIQHEYRGHYMKFSNSYEINNNITSNGMNRAFSYDNDSDKTEVEEIEEADDAVDPLATDKMIKSFQSTTLTNTLNHSVSINNNNNNNGFYDDTISNNNSSKMKRGNSFDQSKSYLTNLRNKFKFHRRGSEQFGMYLI